MFTNRKLQPEVIYHKEFRAATHELLLNGKHFTYAHKNKYGMYIANRLTSTGVETMGYGKTLAKLKINVEAGEDRRVLL